MSLKKIVNYLLSVCDRHSDVNESDFGSEYDNDVSGKYQYPMVFIESNPVSRSESANHSRTYSMALLFLDKHTDEDKDDILRAQDVTEKIMNEFMDYLRYQSQSAPDVDPDAQFYFGFAFPNPALSVAYATDTIAAGWRLEIEVTVGADRCDYKTAFNLNDE